MKYFETREGTAKNLLELIRPLKSFYSRHHGFLNLGATGVHYGSRIAGMEGFARVLWGLGPLFSHSRLYKDPSVLQETEEWKSIVTDGLLHGTDPESEEYWGDFSDFDQRIVEAAAIVVTLSLNTWIWEGLKEKEKKNLYQWLNQVNRCDMPKNNWRFFRILTNMTFSLLGLPVSEEKMKEDRDLIESFYLGDGWYYDGGKDKMDYYIAFAFHFYGLIYAALMQENDPEYADRLKGRGEAFIKDFIYFFANDGSSIPFGRSLTYRFAHCSLFGAVAFADAGGIEEGVLKNLFVRHMAGWMDKPIADSSGILSIGYGYPNLVMSEHYNSSGSPYWALKAFIVLALPEGHKFWDVPCQNFPYEEKKLLKHAHMLITHDSHDGVMAYVTGQHCPGNHGHVKEKYEKFVYSNQFGFSISRGTEINDGAFDNTIAFSASGENRYTMRNGCDSYETGTDFLRMTYRPVSGVKAESIIVPCGSWHVRIHKISCSCSIDVSDGGFSIRAENEGFTGEAGTGIRYSADQVFIEEKQAVIRLPWGVSGMVSLTGGRAEVIQCFPNTNVLYPLTVMPVITYQLEKGEHLLASLVFGNCSGEAFKAFEGMPEVTIESGRVLVDQEGTRIEIPLLSLE